MRWFKKQTEDERFDALRQSFKKDFIKTRFALLEMRMSRDYWKSKYKEMEKRWQDTRTRKTELKVQKLELEAKLSDALATGTIVLANENKQQSNLSLK